MHKRRWSLIGEIRYGLLAAAAAATLALGCSDGSDLEGIDEPDVSYAVAAPEDGLAEAFATFVGILNTRNLADTLPTGYGFNPVLCTETLGTPGHRPKGIAELIFAEHRITATLNDVPEGESFELWFVKNQPLAGLTALPEPQDLFVPIGPFTVTSFDPTKQELDLSVGDKVDFDLDLIVVTRAGQDPAHSRIAVGERTFLEKRFNRARTNTPLDPVSGKLALNVETTDPLIARGAELFFKETFGGNGRTCGTCHRAERNLTIDAAFIKNLPSSDPLFVFKRVPALARLENETQLRNHGLILENSDGFEDPTNNFVMRGVPHTLGLVTSSGITAGANESFPDAPPDHRLGWSGDGPPGRGTLHEFGIGAINQHFPKTLNRRPGIDFRIPTQEELDALEAFQLFSGRSHLIDTSVLKFKEARANRGSSIVFDVNSSCAACHRDLRGDPDNPNFATGVNAIAINPPIPLDDGFLTDTELDQSGKFNPPPLIEAADTAPFFHNNSKSTIEAAVAFYVSPEFTNGPEGNNFNFTRLTTTGQNDVGAFLRVLNAAENIRQVRKRVTFVRDQRGLGNTEILALAIADTNDAINVLAAKSLNSTARSALASVKSTLTTAKGKSDKDRPPLMIQALSKLEAAKKDLFTFNPKNEF